MAGYSTTPLGKKLGYSGETAVRAIGMPDDIRTEIETFEPVSWANSRETAMHVFERNRAELSKHLQHSRNTLPDTGMVWVSWPKKASGVKTDITEDVIREIALPLGYVDVKVCAVDAIWSGLKLVVRKELRAARI